MSIYIGLGSMDWKGCQSGRHLREKLELESFYEKVNSQQPDPHS
jgi:hypothetical protein